jgi:hypothetical protein
MWRVTGLMSETWAWQMAGMPEIACTVGPPSEAMSTTCPRPVPTVLPSNGASPAIEQPSIRGAEPVTPPLVGMAAMPTIGSFRWVPPVEPTAVSSIGAPPIQAGG